MEWVSGNIFIRPNENMRKDDFVAGHKHNFDHTTIVFSGSLHVEATLPNGNTVSGTFTAPSHFLVKKDVEHKITALEDNTTFWCVYSHRDAQGEVVQEKTGLYDAYV